MGFFLLALAILLVCYFSLVDYFFGYYTLIFISLDDWDFGINSDMDWISSFSSSEGSGSGSEEDETSSLTELSYASESILTKIYSSSMFFAILFASSLMYLHDSAKIFYNVLIISSLNVSSFLTEMWVSIYFSNRLIS